MENILIPIGSNCETSHYLRKHNMRNIAYPFDWNCASLEMIYDVLNNIIQQNNYINPHDKIPIVCSHAGVNGYQTMKHAIKVGAAEANSNGTYFRNWSINLSQDEIRIIHDSGGVIGLILDKAILASDSTLGKIDRIKDDQKRKEAYLKLFWDNIFFVINAVKDKSAWEVPVLGSDFDGVINHVEFYNDASKLPDLQKDLVQYLLHLRFFFLPFQHYLTKL